MPAKISGHIESQIVKLHLEGLSQVEIGDRLQISQSTASAAIKRYQRDASRTSLEKASTNRGVQAEIESIQSLASELRKAGVTVSEAIRALKLQEELNKIGGNPDTLEGLIAVYRRITPRGFPIQQFAEATTRMIRLEEQLGIDYSQLASAFEKAQGEFNELQNRIKSKKSELEQITRKIEETQLDLKSQLHQNQLTIDGIQRATRMREVLGKAGLSLDHADPLANLLRVLSDLSVSRGQDAQQVAQDLLEFVGTVRNLNQVTANAEDRIRQLMTTEESLKAQITSLDSDKKKLTLENQYLRDAIDSVVTLRETHKMGVGEILQIKRLADKYGTPASILDALETYNSLKEIKDDKAKLEGSVDELRRIEGSLRGKIKAVEDQLTTLPAKTDDSMRDVNLTLKQFSDNVHHLGSTIEEASERVQELKEKALAAGKEMAAAELRVQSYRITSQMIRFMTDAKGEEHDVVAMLSAFLGRFSEWAKLNPKYSRTGEQITSLKHLVERQMING